MVNYVALHGSNTNLVSFPASLHPFSPLNMFPVHCGFQETPQRIQEILEKVQCDLTRNSKKKKGIVSLKTALKCLGVFIYQKYKLLASNEAF